jgi:hypothetical protein
VLAVVAAAAEGRFWKIIATLELIFKRAARAKQPSLSIYAC